jgi:hypothetical protein
MWRPKPTQPRHPMLVALLERQAARLRVRQKRQARRVLIAAGLDPAILLAAASFERKRQGGQAHERGIDRPGVRRRR